MRERDGGRDRERERWREIGGEIEREARSTWRGMRERE